MLQTLHFRDDQGLYCGDDELTLPFLSIRAKGAISVVSNLFPAEFREVVLLFLQDRVKQSQEHWKKFQPLMEPLFREGNPSGIKSALSMFGLCSPHLRLPLTPPLKPALDDLEQALRIIANTLSVPILS
jgi:4-hydroxy-tetrahydrodipicolinate synthase